MKPYKIKEPIWGGGERCVGIAEFRLGQKIEITYENKCGARVFPHIYHISKEKALKYPLKIVGGGVRLRIVPIKEMELC